MSEWTKKIKDEARGLIAEAEQELTALEGADTVDLTADETDADSDAVDTDTSEKN
ncbi:hypothetical protein HQ346_11995 [Rhodococcus sp. BP-252]|uniref:hypothetical protein n=1 Tax=Nocardiaceae TaxID=85025 RepID=UPI000B0462F9|nr:MULTISPECIES: hypothetical protein [Rhodococcus]MBY6412395.1 hypothetical protein [Rhodococcus sp. BP-320]MBY6416975.1 hypothetical protein [Rhodococcus sp. BP-321]MBY6422062.1 hypothetical protein [Rhodococcus sp. BP-324]MBY6426999.1 hypothetical protein [Rhodococcus sp. BP-323]MBY6432328.1 hypothetical protein [Rhodococcus sp. BP-322]